MGVGQEGSVTTTVQGDERPSSHTRSCLGTRGETASWGGPGAAVWSVAGPTFLDPNAHSPAKAQPGQGEVRTHGALSARFSLNRHFCVLAPCSVHVHLGLSHPQDAFSLMLLLAPPFARGGR